MHADGGEEIGIGRGHDRGRGPAGREPGDIDPLRVDGILAHDLAGDARDQRRARRGRAAGRAGWNQFQHAGTLAEAGWAG